LLKTSGGATMATRGDAEIVVVLPKDRRQLLERKDDVFVHSEDEDIWERPSKDEESWLVDFLQDKYRGAPKRFWTVKVGVRIGYDEQGVFLHKDHLKRYFGLDVWEVSFDDHAGAAVQKVCGKSGNACHAEKSDDTSGSSWGCIVCSRGHVLPDSSSLVPKSGRQWRR